MRASAADKARSRARIVAAASGQFRSGGLDGASVGAIMQEAGLTHGGFYRHFADKDALVSAALAAAFEGFTTPLAEATDQAAPEAVRQFITDYLSPEHRDSPALGCPIAALGAEVARQGQPVRSTFTQAVEQLLLTLGRGLPGPEPRTQAVRTLAMLVGGLILARAVDGELSDEILRVLQPPPLSPTSPSP